MSAFALTTDARVKTVTKDLLVNLQHLGIERTLKEARETVSKMYGYAGWQDLISKLAAEADQEDYQASPDVVSQRIHLQERVLLEEGVPSDQVRILRKTLSITGRSKGDDLPRTILEVDGGRYHPIRIGEAMEWLIFREGQFRESGHVYRDYPEHFDSENDDGYAVLKHLVSLGKTMPLDNSALSEERHQMALDLADAAISDRKIFDIAPLGKSVPHQIGNVPEGVAFLCFGQNAWPSPYISAGIEGCYIERYEEGEIGNVMLAVSDDLIPGESTFSIGRKEAITLLKQLRLAHFTFTLDEQRIPTFVPQDEYSKHFTGYVDGPANLALKVWSNMAAYQDFVGFAVAPDTFEEFKNRLSRTRSPEMIEETLDEMSHYEDDFGIVRLLGGPPDETIPEAPVVEIKDPVETAIHFHEASDSPMSEEDVEHFTHLSDAAARAALAAGLGEAPQLEGIVAINAIMRANRLLSHDLIDEVLRETQPLLNHDHSRARTCAQVMVMAHAVLDKKDDLVLDVMRSVEAQEPSYPGITAWVLALGEAYLQPYGDRPLLRAAMTENPLIGTMLDGGMKERNYQSFPNIWPEPASQAKLVISYLHDAWMAATSQA